MNLPVQYKYLLQNEAPNIIKEAIKLYGTKEVVGPKHNQEILSWAKELGLEKVYTNDEIAWCGLAAAIFAKRAGYVPVKDPLWARNWSNFGNKQKEAMLGDILVFSRESGGHVGLYVGEDPLCYHVLGGNQSNSINITRIKKDRCISINRCPWKIGQPLSVKKIFLNSDGSISTNEA